MKIDDSYKISNILFIKDVFLEDCTPIDDLFEKKLLDSIEKDNPIIKFNTIPSTFTDMDSWIKKVNIPCWYCNLAFDNAPVFIPTVIEPVSGGYNIGTEGCFCSFPCAMKHINLYDPKFYTNIKKKNMLYLLYKIFHNKNVIEIYQSPCKFEMIHYGNGDKTIQKYKSEIKDIENRMIREAKPNKV